MAGVERVERRGEVTLRGTDAWRFASECAGVDFEIRVAEPTPGPMSPPADRHGVLYVLDGDLFFGTATEMTRLQSMLFGELPPLRVVGIGYGTNDPRIQGETRNRDFTPTADARFEAMGRQMRPDWEPLLPEGQRMGGADRFLDFLEKELKPFIEGTYPVDGQDSTLFGSSMGGLCATWALLTRPQAFRRYVIASPALWWDDGVVFRAEEARAERGGDLEARAYFGVGSLEEGAGIPGLDAWKMISNPRRLVALLESRAYPSLVGTFQVLDGESHTSVVPVALTRGLRHLYRR
ncbi:MAG: alpha/beta hydrolase-fold protein [Gemmatimonadota bacterium]